MVQAQTAHVDLFAGAIISKVVASCGTFALDTKGMCVTEPGFQFMAKESGCLYLTLASHGSGQQSIVVERKRNNQYSSILVKTPAKTSLSRHHRVIKHEIVWYFVVLGCFRSE
jgi:hypothetical protein